VSLGLGKLLTALNWLAVCAREDWLGGQGDG